ncbi:hypothetical protein I79_015048 [Cricetulus griseus]|uniref:Uncharacterized protein n=1 Tax=Cricetulus griseus TaxID=10029 RepID=G3GSE3_CRIGR|nr:hypothetical protein I79_000466 [Cricetulus griseus]EGW11438.1 hypothetical protein I79_015048 [Cricetulus griseus]
MKDFRINKEITKKKNNPLTLRTGRPDLKPNQGHNDPSPWNFLAGRYNSLTRPQDNLTEYQEFLEGHPALGS